NVGASSFVKPTQSPSQIEISRHSESGMDRHRYAFRVSAEKFIRARPIQAHIDAIRAHGTVNHPMSHLGISKEGLDVKNYLFQIINCCTFIHMLVVSSHLSMLDNRPRIDLFVIRFTFPENEKRTPPVSRCTKSFGFAT